MIIGVTGHRFYDASTAGYLRSHVRDLLLAFSADDGDARLVSSLAEGADQLVARVAVDLGIPVDAVLPAEGYRESLDEEFAAEFDRLLSDADTVTTLDFAAPDPASYLAGGLAVLERSDALIAVWDGEQARGSGGTAEIVEEARARGVAVHVVWPEGYVRGATA